jgi:predicted transcriptional regulator of viral defense system
MGPTTKTYKKGLTSKESLLLSTLARLDKHIFSIQDAKRVAKDNTKKILHSLVEKKWVLPLKRGLYVIVPLDIGVKGADAYIIHNFVIAGNLTTPYYIAYWSALNYHGLSDQIPSSTFIAITQAKKPLRILDMEYHFVRLERNKFYGIMEIEVEGSIVKVSDPEKTIVDCLDHPEHAGGIDEVARSIYFSHEELDFKKIKDYAKRMKNITILKRLGFILEKTGLLEKYRFVFAGFKPSKGYPALDKLSPKKGTHNSKWGLLINKEVNPDGWMY